MALAGVDLTVAPGEVVGLLGRNGAGKTTLLRAAMGMLHVHAGSIKVLGLDPWRQPVEMKRRVGHVSEEQVFPAHLTVEQVLALHRELFTTWDLSLEGKFVRRFDVNAGAPIKALSKGQARQLTLICALAHRPELLLLDEPAGGLDPAARREILEAAIALLSETGSTIVFSSHHMADVERIAQRVVLLEKGRVLVDQPLDTLREAYSLVLGALCVWGSALLLFLGSAPSMSVMSSCWSGQEKRPWRVRAEFYRHT